MTNEVQNFMLGDHLVQVFPPFEPEITPTRWALARSHEEDEQWELLTQHWEPFAVVPGPAAYTTVWFRKRIPA